MNVELETAYIGIDCTAPAAVASYLQDVVGLMPGEAREGASSTWRVDNKAMRLWLQEAGQDAASGLPPAVRMRTSVCSRACGGSMSSARH